MSNDLGADLAKLAFTNWGRIVGLELLLRITWTEQALASDDPEGYMTELVEMICASMSEVAPATDPVNQEVYGHAEDYLRDFAQNVTTRVRNALNARR